MAELGAFAGGAGPAIEGGEEIAVGAIERGLGAAIGAAAIIGKGERLAIAGAGAGPVTMIDDQVAAGGEGLLPVPGVAHRPHRHEMLHHAVAFVIFVDVDQAEPAKLRLLRGRKRVEGRDDIAGAVGVGGERDVEALEQGGLVVAAGDDVALQRRGDRAAGDLGVEIGRIADVGSRIAERSRSGIGKATVVVTSWGARLRKT